MCVCVCVCVWGEGGLCNGGNSSLLKPRGLGWGVLRDCVKLRAYRLQYRESWVMGWGAGANGCLGM